MEKELASSSTTSGIILSSSKVETQGDDEGEEEDDEGDGHGNDEEKTDQKSNQWSSRFKCYAAYVCCISCYSSFQINCLALSGNGLLGFIPLILARIFIAFPVIIIQIMLSRYIMTNLSHSWSMHITAKGILFCEMLATAYYIIHTLVTTSYLLEYLFLSFTSPWDSCDSTWATMSCYEIQKYHLFFAKCLESYTQDICESLDWELSGAEYWKYVVANKENSMSIFLNAVHSFIAIVLVFAMTVKGLRSAEKIFEFFVIISLILASVMACIIYLIPEFNEGLKHVFEINVGILLNINTWVNAYDATIFVLAIGRLPLAFVSSHAKFDDDIFSDVIVVCLADIFFCLLITIPTLCVIDRMNPYEDTIYSSDSLDIFISLSEMVLLFSPPRNLWAILYYLLLNLITMGSLSISMLALVDTISGYDPQRFNHFYTSLFLCGFCFLGSVGFLSNEFSFSLQFDKSVISTLFLYLFTLEILYGFQMFNDDFHFMMGYPVPFFLKFSWLISLPISFVMIVLNAIIYHVSPHSNVSNYFFLGIPLFIYVFIACIRIGIGIYHSKTLSQLCLPNPNWGPAQPLYKKSRLLFDSRAVTKEFIYRQELQEKPFVKPPDILEQGIVHVI